LTQRALLLLLAAALAGAGYYAFVRLPIDAFPDVSPTQVKIIVKAPGMTPQEVETRITAPIELELLGIPNQVMLRSIFQDQQPFPCIEDNCGGPKSFARADRSIRSPGTEHKAHLARASRAEDPPPRAGGHPLRSPCASSR
jgi:hypothetical protein